MSTNLRGYLLLSFLLLCLSFSDSVYLPDDLVVVPEDASDFQSRYAIGLPLRYHMLDLIDLESVEGIGKETAWHLYMYQVAVLASSCEFGAEERWRGFEVIPGIGKKSAQNLAGKLSLSDYEC